MLDKLRKTFKPEVFQGSLDHDRYFEGWYFKLVDREQQHRLALIPGISLDRAGGTSHAFVQAIDGNTAETAYFEYPLEEFSASSEELRVRIGPNTFTDRGFDIDLRDGERRISGKVGFANLVPWPRRLLAPGVMGWYSFVPRMECYHGLVSLDHDLDGAVTWGDEERSFTGGRGYIEKDWGTSFPSAYTWMQSNHFDERGVSFMASVARIPWLGSSFTGFLAILWLRGRMHVFTTYTGAKLETVKLGEASVRLVLSDKRHRLEVRATRDEGAEAAAAQEGFGLLQSPTDGAMRGRIAETLTAELQVRLTRHRRLGRPAALLFDGTGRSAGFEVEASGDDLQP